MNVLCTYPVCGDNGNKVCRRMTLHSPSPVGHRVALQYRLTADSGGVKEHICAHKSHTACRLRKPLIPAYADTDTAELCIPYLKACVARCEVELLLIEMVIGNVALTVYSHKRAVTVYHSYRIEKCVSVLFIEADGDNRTGFLCDLHKTLYGRIFFGFVGKIIVIVILLLTKVRKLEQLGEKYHIRSVRCRLSYHTLCLCYIFFTVVTAAHLYCRNLDITYHREFPF